MVNSKHCSANLVLKVMLPRAAIRDRPPLNCIKQDSSQDNSGSGFVSVSVSHYCQHWDNDGDMEGRQDGPCPNSETMVMQST